MDNNPSPTEMAAFRPHESDINTMTDEWENQNGELVRDIVTHLKPWSPGRTRSRSPSPSSFAAAAAIVRKGGTPSPLDLDIGPSAAQMIDCLEDIDLDINLYEDLDMSCEFMDNEPMSAFEEALLLKGGA